MTAPAAVVCPACGHQFIPDAGATRATEAVEADNPNKPYGDVNYADPGYQKDGKARYPLDTEQHVRAAWSYINQSDNAAQYTSDQLKNIKGRIRAAAKRFGIAIADQATEAGTVTDSDRLAGRVIEAKGTGSDGGRIFRVRVIAYGDSKNARRYPEAVMRAAAPLYEGVKAYDHHRAEGELRSSTISGLVGYYRNAEATGDGIEADLHLLPSATRAAEALDTSLTSQGEGLSPLVGISHDVMAMYRPIVAGGQRLQEATAIVKVNSADIVADPAAGGQATRMVAGGTEITETDPASVRDESTKESDVTITTADVLAAFKDADDDALAAVGLRKVSESTTTTEPSAASAVDSAPVGGEPSTESTGTAKASFMGKFMIRQMVADAGLPESAVEAVTALLPEQVTEADLSTQIAALKTSLGLVERTGLTPTNTAAVTREAVDKKRDALDAFFAGDYVNGYRSFREAFADFTGRRPKSFDEDYNRVILRESLGEYDSGVTRSTESMDSTTWNLVLGDSITRRMVAEYVQPSLQTWRQVVSSTPPVNDFRIQRIQRVGGYGVLPAVNQGAPYQPRPSPPNEEVTYTFTKPGGTEDITLEMIANDDIRAIQRIPGKLGLAAAQTLYRFVWDILPTNAATSYDATALFAVGHANTDNPAVLGQSTLSVGRRKMRKQTAYGDSSDVLSFTPRVLVVPPDLEEIAFQLATSAVAIPSTPAGPTDTPNIHQGLQVIVVDYYSDTNDWYLVCDPAMCPTIEVGFYQGRQDPELFTQSDPSVGSVFNADKVTYKIRHIYSGTVLDHRGFYRGSN